MLEETIKRHQAFWRRGDTDRALLGINVGFFVNERFPRVMAELPAGAIGPDEIPIRAFLDDCDALHESHRGFGDYPFVSAPFVGVPWLEAIAGCPVVASPSSLWAEPCVEDWRTWRGEEDPLDTPWARKLFELMRALVEHSHDRYTVAPTLMRGPADILAAMRGMSRFPLDLIDTPELVAQPIEYCARLWEDVGRAQLALIPHSEEGYVAGDAALRTWAPDKVLWLQEDAMSLLSPPLYRKFFLPVDEGLSGAFPCVAYHLHGSALWAIDDLVRLPGLNVIELNLEAAQCDVEGTFAGWAKIQAHKPLVIWRVYGNDFGTWLERVRREFSPAGLSIQVSVKDVAEARQVEEMFFR